MSTKVILHVTTSLHGLWIHVPFKFLEDLVVALAHDVGQHIESTAVWHTQNGSVHAGICCCGENLVNDRNHRLCTLKTKALCSYVFRCKELFKCFCRIETFENPQLLVKRWRECDTFQLGLNPTLLISVLNVHVFNTNGSAVCITQNA